MFSAPFILIQAYFSEHTPDSFPKKIFLKGKLI